MKSKAPVAAQILDKLDCKYIKLSRAASGAELLMHGHDIDSCIANVAHQQQLNLLKLFTDKIGFEAKWNIDKNDAAWCYVPEDKIVLVEQHNLLPAALKKTQDKRYILIFKEMSKQDLSILIPSLIQKIQPTVVSSQTNGFGIFDHSSQTAIDPILPKPKECKISL